MTDSASQLGKRLDNACSAYSKRPAVSDDTGSISYAVLAEHAEAFSGSLSAAGLQRDEPVLVAVSNKAKDFSALMAVWKAGGVAVPLHRRALASTSTDMLARTGARLILNVTPDEPLAGIGSGSAAVHVRHDDPPPPRDILTDAAWIVFTSGSTDCPKGVVHTHDRYLAKLNAINEALDLPSPQRMLMPLQLTFAYAHWVSLTTLLRGGEVILASPFSPAEFLYALTNGPTACAVVPTMLRQLLPMIEQGRNSDFSGIVMSGGEILPEKLGRSLKQRWSQMQLWDVFGLTETGTSDFYVRPDEYHTAAGTIGRPAPGIDFRLAPESGELEILTPFLMRGYLDEPELTSETLNEGYFRTGDQARQRPDGTVEITGRLKDIINRAGNKISPMEVERLFLSHPDVEQALAAGVSDANTGESLHILVVPRRGVQLVAGALMKWAAERMDRHKLPDVIHLGTELPIGETGKADRKVLRARIAAKDLTGTP